VYLLTDWGTGEITVQVWENHERSTDVKIEWRHASRGDVKRIVQWLEEQGEEEPRPRHRRTVRKKTQA
jgi:hypothetical protein